MNDNQSPPLENYNVFRGDRALTELVERDSAFDARELAELGELAGSADTIALGFDANEHPPELRREDVRFHPAWHALLREALNAGLAGTPWSDPSPGAHRRRAAKFFIWGQVESGHGCPVSMTYAAVPVLRGQPELAAIWLPVITRACYDPRSLPIREKDGGLCGMGMTEKQGGSDVRTNRTRATPAAQSGAGNEYLLNGEKWFCSAPMNDAFLVLAQAPDGLSCFLVPRLLGDGSRNAMRIVRLKDKLGNRSNASAEVEFEKAHGWLIGDEGEGLARIVEMVNHTRLDCAIGSAALMRSAVAQAIHHATYRQVFGKPLIDQPLMQNVLADLALESEAALLFFMRVARSIDESASDPRAAALKRIGTALAKYYVCKRTPAVVGEALECSGGNGYVEESVMPRLYREAPLNSIWEGSGSINALDVMRILYRQPDALAAWHAEIEPASDEPRIARELQLLGRAFRERSATESQARALSERMAQLWQAALLRRFAPDFVADAFLISRLEGRSSRTFGTLPEGVAFRRIVDRAAPTEAVA